MKVAVYTIALNEEAHCERWAESVKEADYRIVLDTGSRDKTIDKLKSLGVDVYQQHVVPWRFDVARNAALALVPHDADICISMDMDEFMEPGWRQRMESIWTSGTTRIGYTYVFDYKEGAEKQQGFYADKIHARHGYEWRRPVHENVYAVDGRDVISTDMSITMNQIQDRSKPTRSNYLPLLKMAHEEDPKDSQIAFWYGRELMYFQNKEESAKVLERYLEIPTSTWKSERSEALIYLSRMDTDNSWKHLMSAAAECPTRREVWYEIVQYCYDRQDWINLLWAAMNGIEKSRREGSYLDRNESWGSRIPDLGSIGAYHCGWLDKAVSMAELASRLNPEDGRIQRNLELMVNAKKGQQ